MGLARRLLGLGLVLACFTPVFLLLDHPGTGVPGERTVSIAWTWIEAGWWGSLTVLGAGFVLATVLPVARVRGAFRAVGRWLERPAPWIFALVLGLSSGALAALASRHLFAGLPTLGDGMASLVHARYLAAGELAGSLPDPRAAWLIPNTLLADAGWVSQYPPLHLLLLAAGLRTGIVGLVGPLLLAITVVFTCRIAELLLPDRLATARTGAVLAAASPFLVFLGAGYLSHVSAAALSAGTLYAALRSLRSAGWAWPLATGAAAGATVACRPWIGLFLAVVLPAGLWTVWTIRRADPSALARRLAAASAGGAPWLLALAAYNRRVFGDPLTFGYTASYGEAHLPGFGSDPWGNAYGLREAAGYAGADILALGTHLLESPLPATLVIGSALLLLRRLPRGTGVLLGWALLPVAAGALYWHHGFHMGPRMLYEAAPAWCLLFAVGAVELARSRYPTDGGTPDPERTDRSGGTGVRSRATALLARRGRESVLLALVLSLPAGLFFAIERARTYAWDAETLARIRAPEPLRAPALVFVHGSWSERVAAHLRAAGMTADSVETALRRNDLCAVHRYALHRDDIGERTGRSVELRLEPLPGTPSFLERVELSPGYRIRRDPDRPWNAACEREAAADRAGVISLLPLLWQGDLPGIETGRPLFVRDLGPRENERLRARFPDRSVYVYRQPGPGERPELRSYPAGMAALWGAAAGDTSGISR